MAGQLILGLEQPPDASFDEVRVGMQAVSGAVEYADGVGLSVLAQLASEVAPCKQASLAELAWEQVAERAVRPVHLVATITRWGSDGSKDRGRIVQDLRLVDTEGVEVQRARALWRVPSVTITADPSRLALEFGSVAWGQRIGERLRVNGAFRSTTKSFDGAIGFSAGPDEVQFRIYRGEIIEISRKAVDGGTFTINASELTWLHVLTDPTNDFVRRGMTTGGFKVRGDGFQYVRMIKAIMLILDEARAEVAEAFSA